MIHAAVFGSFERMIGMLTEHYTGAFPTWLAPVQVKILPVGEGHIEFANKLASQFSNENIRIEIDDSPETVGNKTRKAVNEKIPYILVVGAKEMETKSVAVRPRIGNQEVMPLNAFIEKALREIKEKA
jgi:threonyl-tRNA synthetase